MRFLTCRVWPSVSLSRRSRARPSLDRGVVGHGELVPRAERVFEQGRVLDDDRGLIGDRLEHLHPLAGRQEGRALEDLKHPVHGTLRDERRADAGDEGAAIERGGTRGSGIEPDVGDDDHPPLELGHPSVRFSSLMSRETPKVPIVHPRSPWSGSFVVRTHDVWPPSQLLCSSFVYERHSLAEDPLLVVEGGGRPLRREEGMDRSFRSARRHPEDRMQARATCS